MKKYTADEFKFLIAENPRWAEHIEHEVEITTYCEMPHSTIECLSPLLTFSGKNEEGEVADFTGAHNLKTAEATFKGGVILSRSGITTTKGVNITEPNNKGRALALLQCDELKVVEGTFPGKIDCANCPMLETTEGLIIAKSDKFDQAANFTGCFSLKTATGNYAGYANWGKAGIEKIHNLVITDYNIKGRSANFFGCRNLRIATGTFPGRVSFEESGIVKAENLHVKKPEVKVDKNDWQDEKAPVVTFKNCLQLKSVSGKFEGSIELFCNPTKKLIEIECEGAKISNCPNIVICPDQILKHPDTLMDDELHKFLTNRNKAFDAIHKRNKSQTHSLEI